MALIRFRNEAAMLAPVYERKIVNPVVPVRSVFVPAYPRRVGLDILVTVRALNANRPLIQVKEEQTASRYQGDYEGKESAESQRQQEEQDDEHGNGNRPSQRFSPREPLSRFQRVNRLHIISEANA
jgi:hypothetical protein